MTTRFFHDWIYLLLCIFVVFIRLVLFLFVTGEIISINYSPEKAADCRDATAKAIYGRLFNYIVSFVNGVLSPEYTATVTKIGK